MPRGKPCTVCSAPNRAQIDALIVAGAKLKDIATQLPELSPYALSRHKRRCLVTTQPANGDGNSLEAQLALWTGRANELYLASTVNADARGQSQAIAVAFRSLEFALRASERMQEQKRDNTGHEWNVNERDEAFVRDLRSIDRLVSESEALTKIGDTPQMGMRKKGFAAILELERAKPDALPQAVEALVTILGCEPPKSYCVGRLTEN
jgi:hypothetical protein